MGIRLVPYPYWGLTTKQGETWQGKRRVNGHPGAGRSAERGLLALGSARAEQRDATLHFDLDAAETLLQPLG